MKRTLIRYETKVERAEENERLIKSVFQELHATSPEGVRYLALKLADNTFVHFVGVDSEDRGNPIPRLEAFRSFQNGIEDRCVDPPRSSVAVVIGNYKMLSE